MRQLLELIANNPACAEQHFGAWMVEPRWFLEKIAAINQGLVVPNQAAAKSKDDGDLYVMDGDVAVLPIHGSISKGRSSFGGTSSIEARATIRDLAADPDVAAIMLHVDSPGGTAAGTAELADDIFAASKRKPVHAHASDLMASAAAFAGLQASRVTVNASGEVGSFGTVARLTDISEAVAKQGIKVHVASTGPYKGAFSPGAPITEDHLAYAKELIDSMNQPFVEGVRRGRANMTKGAVRDLFYGQEGGKVWPAKRALELGIVDAVESFDQAMATLQAEVRSANATMRMAVSDRSRRRRAEFLSRSIALSRS